VPIRWASHVMSGVLRRMHPWEAACGAAHVARVQRIQALQADGFPLDLIRRMLSSADDEGVIAFTRALKAPFQDEPSQAIDAAELARRFDIHSTDALDSAIALGLVLARDDGSLEVVSPRLLRTGETMGELGLTGDELLEVTAVVRQHIDSVTEIFARIYRDYVWEPFDRAGRPSDGWAEIRAVLERLRPLALDTVRGHLQAEHGLDGCAGAR